MINLKFKKVMMSLLASFCTIKKNPKKNRNSEEAIMSCSGKKGSLIALAKSFERILMKFIFNKVAASWNYIIVSTSKAWQVHHLQQRGIYNIEKKYKWWDLEHFSFIRGELRVFSCLTGSRWCWNHFCWGGGGGVGGGVVITLFPCKQRYCKTLKYIWTCFY